MESKYPRLRNKVLRMLRTRFSSLLPVLAILGSVTFLGLGTSWLLLLASGAAGNLLNLLLRRGPHLSVGLSTAVFAAVGLLTGRQLICPGARSPRALLPPLGAGAGLLALLGSGGVRTDLGAHLCGFAVGLLAGLFLALVPDRALPRRPLVQAGLFGLAVTAVLACWRLALR